MTSPSGPYYSISPYFLLPIVTHLYVPVVVTAGHPSLPCTDIAVLFAFASVTVFVKFCASPLQLIRTCLTRSFFFFLTSMLCFKLTYFPGSLSSSCFGWDHSPHCVHFSLCRLHYFIELYLFVAFSPFLHTHASIISLRAKTYVFLISVVSILALFWHTYPQ